MRKLNSGMIRDLTEPRYKIKNDPLVGERIHDMHRGGFPVWWAMRNPDKDIVKMCDIMNTLYHNPLIVLFHGKFVMELFNNMRRINRSAW